VSGGRRLPHFTGFVVATKRFAVKQQRGRGKEELFVEKAEGVVKKFQLVKELNKILQ